MTNIVNATELNEIEDAVAGFIKDFKEPITKEIGKIDKQIDELHVKSRDRTYDMVAALVELALAVMPDAPTPGYQSFLVSRSISKPAQGHNPFMAFIKAVFAVKLNGVWVFGKEQRSYEKHANHVRFLVNAKREGLIQGSVQDFIRAYPEMLKGIEAQDRKNNPNAAQASRVEKARNLGRTAAARAKVSETFSANEGDLLKVYGRVRDGQLELLHADVVSNDNERESIFFKIGSPCVHWIHMKRQWYANFLG